MATIELPSKWQISQLAVHFEGEDLRDDPRPFAANVVAQLRFDVDSNEDLESIMDRDLLAAQQVSDSFEIHEKKISGSSGHVEYSSSADGHQLRQLSVYQQSEGDTYTITATHRADRFEKVRRDFATIIERLLRSYRD